jgi:hypothetical protein
MSLASNPVQSYFFAQLIQVITYTGEQLQAAVNHWALMFFILALSTGTSYFILGWSSNTISMVRAHLGYSILWCDCTGERIYSAARNHVTCKCGVYHFYLHF